MRAFSIVLLIAVAGCASSFERMKQIREAAPDWYDARKQELSGKGYPRLIDVPEPVGGEVETARLSIRQQETLDALDEFSADPKSFDEIDTPEALIAWSDAVRLSIEAQIPPADFLTDDDVAAMKAVFDRPRGRL